MEDIASYVRDRRARREVRRNSRKFVTPILAPASQQRGEREDVLPIKNFTDKLSKLSELSEHTPGPVYISEEVRYFVPSLHKFLTLSWKRRPSDDDVASRSPRQLNPRIVVIEYPDPRCHS